MKKIFSALFVVALFAPTLAFASVGITLNGANPQTVIAGQTYVDPGFSALSTVNGDVTANVSASTVNTAVAGNTSRTYSVSDIDNTDPLNPVTSTATATRDITVMGTGGSLLFCSGPEAPGYTVGVMGGGCGGSTMFVPFGHALTASFGTTVGDVCQFAQGCMVEKK